MLPPVLEAEQLERLSRTALEVAREAGELVGAAWRAGVRVREKAHADLVTEHDVATERLIRARLEALTPDIPVVGEEEGDGGDRSDVGTAAPRWYCDPIDGTTNFVHGHPFFCVSIGLMAGTTPLAGAVVAPALGTSWHGAVGVGAWRDDARCGVSPTERLEDALLATGWHPRSPPEMRAQNLRNLERVWPISRGVRRCGAAALDLCLVADGTYDAFWERMLGAWDTAAGAALVLAAGGRVTDLAGGPADVRIGHLVASNGRIHDALVDLLDARD